MEPRRPEMQVTSEQIEAARALLGALALVRGSKSAVQQGEYANQPRAPAAQGTGQTSPGAENSARYEALQRAALAPIDYEDAVLKWQSAYRWMEKLCGNDPRVIDAVYSLAKSEAEQTWKDPS